MTCYNPLSAFKTSSGISWNPYDKNILTPLKLPCGQCTGCRLERSRQWAMRCVHEASLYKSNCFLTLTYDDDHLPYDHSLDVTHFQKFMKRLRFDFSGHDEVNGKYPIRFFHCGEYGSQTGRPHYHALLFNFDFSDKQVHTVRDNVPLYTSPTLSRLWPYGFSTIGAVTFESAAYVARYVMKKYTGKNADDHYEYIVPKTGERLWRKPEYVTMSRRPGIASGWFAKYSSDVYPHDSIPMRGLLMRPPKFYDAQLQKVNPDLLEELKFAREKNSHLSLDNSIQDRLDVREQVKLLSIKSLVRNL